MAPAIRSADYHWPLSFIALAVLALVSACRAFGFGEGVLLGVTPASGLALGAGVLLRVPRAIAAAAGFALAGAVWGLPLSMVAADAIVHGLAAIVAAFTMRTLARRRQIRSKTGDWLIFLVGGCVFTIVVAAGWLVSGVLGLFGTSSLWEAPLLALAFEPLGILTLGAVLASVTEFPRIRANPRPALGVVALGAFLLVALWLLLHLPMRQVSPSGVTLVLSVPFCLWVAMQRRSLDGAALSLVASLVALMMLLQSVGSIDSAEYVTAVIYLNLLVATCQLVHAVNLDRLTALSEIEARKRELEERVVQRTARLNAMTERALAADAAKSRFLATVSHELRTPLNGVLGMASVILAGNLDGETRRNLRVIRSSGYHLLDVINRLLDFSELDQGQRRNDASEFDLRALVEEVLEETRFLPYADGLDLSVDFDADLQPLRIGDRQGLCQVLTNLLGNGAKFTAQGSVAARIVAHSEDAVRFEVQDTGSGIAPSDLERIFLPYEKSGRSPHPGYDGTGLGLTICSEIVRRMGGAIDVESKVGTGSLFWFEVPLPAVIVSEDRKPHLESAVLGDV
jgi:signal transduction histidine kinase